MSNIAVDHYSEHNHLFSLHPAGNALTEEHHAERQNKQAFHVAKRIEEIMNGPEPLTRIMHSKLAHRGLGYDKLYDEAIEALREAFNLDSSAIKDASMDAFKQEQARRERIKVQAKAAARRAGLQVEEDEASLVPKGHTDPLVN